ncbi:hypothetical protein Tco_0909728, partial [Tanacetum coccineum]
TIQDVPTADSGTDSEPLEKVQYDAEYNVFANERQHSEQPESINNTCVVEKVDSNVILDSPDMCDNDIQNDQNAKEYDDERDVLANLIASLTLDTEENKKILKTTQTRAPQLSQTSRNTDHRVSISTGVIHRTNVSIPQLRSTQMKDKVVPNNSQVKFKKTEVEDHHRISSISNKTNSVTTCNDSLKSKTSNVNAVCATCGKCVFNSNHDACVSKFLNEVNARTKKPKVGTISNRQPKSQVNKSVATPPKKIVASKSTIQKSKSYYMMLYEKTSKAWKWKEDVNTSITPTMDNASRITNIVQLILFIVDSGCTKHMTGNLKLLCNFVEKYLGTVRVGNDQFAPILGYRDLGNDLLTGNRGSDLYTISLQKTSSPTLICFMAKSSPTQA